MTRKLETLDRDNRNPVTQISFHPTALAYLTDQAAKGWSVPTLVSLFRDRYPAIRINAGNIDATCRALGIERVLAKRNTGKVANPHRATKTPLTRIHSEP